LLLFCSGKDFLLHGSGDEACMASRRFGVGIEPPDE